MVVDYDNELRQPTIIHQQFIQTLDKQVKHWLTRSPILQTVHYLANERLQQWQEQQQGMLVTSIGRLTDQKALLLRQPYQDGSLLSALLTSLDEQQGRMIILGSGDKDIELEFMQLMAQHDNLLFLNGYADSIADHLYQQGQLFLMPSSFEPCGISQMLAMRAGQPCLVHAVGGLKDTVLHNVNGFSFHGATLVEQTDALYIQFNASLSLIKQDPQRWKTLSENAKTSRFSWQNSIEKYIHELYCLTADRCEHVA